jgi:uncharacterized protein YidB (DUF937 family)
MKALLGVLAVAGYQNRDKIGEFLRGLQDRQRDGASAPQPSDGQAGVRPGGFGDLLGGLTAGGILSGGLGDLLKTFQQNGQGEKAESWVKPGPNAEINDGELEQALGAETLDELAAKTGLSREEILARLSRDLPKAVDDLTPNGQVPSAEDNFLSSASNNTSRGQTSI